jgi:hypothetical protein
VDLPSGTVVQVLGFKHATPAANFVCGDWFRYLLGMFGRWWSQMSVLTTLEKDLPQPEGKITPKYLEDIRTVLGKLLNVPLLDGLGADEYLGFLQEAAKQGKRHAD